MMPDFIRRNEPQFSQRPYVIFLSTSKRKHELRYCLTDMTEVFILPKGGIHST